MPQVKTAKLTRISIQTQQR